MNHINNALVQGYLCRDPIVRTFSSGAVVANFTIASHTRHINRADQPAEETAFVSCVAWGKVAEALVDRHKGQLLLAIGRLRTEAWEQHGKPRHSLVMACNSVHPPQLTSRETGVATEVEAGRTESAEGPLNDQPPF